MSAAHTDARWSGEWLEADGLGGYASGPVFGPRTRRYHGLLLVAAPAGGQRFCLVNGVELVVSTHAGTWFLTSQRYRGGASSWGPAPACEPGVTLLSFDADPWPRWLYQLGDGTTIAVEILCPHRAPQTLLSVHLRSAPGGDVALRMRPFFSGRDHHALHSENPVFGFSARAVGDRQHFDTYPGVPGVVIASNGRYRADPHWYRGFEYSEEIARGFPGVEDLAAPGEFHFTLQLNADAASVHSGVHAAHLVLAATGPEMNPPPPPADVDAVSWAHTIESKERARRSRFASPLHRAADAYFIYPKPTTSGTAAPPVTLTTTGPTEPAANAVTLIAGYPWFSDWGRDTFISLRGLALATGRWDLAGDVLVRWAGAVSGGMLPNRFTEDGQAPEYNSVDAALWYVIAADACLSGSSHNTKDARQKAAITQAVKAILDGHLQGTRHRIRVDDDGLLAAGVPGLQLTWMDAKVGDHVVTARVGKPVEIQALWLNALAIGARLCPARADAYRAQQARGHSSFVERFWNPARACLYDVIDVDHEPGALDARLRPNQLFAVGGLPLGLLPNDRARAVVDTVEAKLLTPVGLRTLAPDEAGYVGRYGGDPEARDHAYHQGTVWPWLLGPFVEAWVRVRGDDTASHHQARARFISPWIAAVEAGATAGVGHVSEVFDGDAPHRPGGCPFQAWSLGELLRLNHLVLR
jgi:glycogen debranching enzyme